MKDLIGKIATISGGGLPRPTECKGFVYNSAGTEIRWLDTDGKSLTTAVPIGSISVHGTPAADPEFVPPRPEFGVAPPMKVRLADVPADVRAQILAEAKQAEDAESAKRPDGPTLVQFIAAGYEASAYPPEGYAVREDADADAAIIADLKAKDTDQAKAVLASIEAAQK